MYVFAGIDDEVLPASPSADISPTLAQIAILVLKVSVIVRRTYELTYKSIIF